MHLKDSFQYSVLTCLLAVLANVVPARNPPEKSGFIENKGQILNQNHEVNDDVLFLYSGKGIKIQLRQGGYSYELFHINGAAPTGTGGDLHKSPQGGAPLSIQNFRMDIDFKGGKPPAKILKEDKSESYFNYYTDGKEAGMVASYGKITYKNVFKNTDIEFVIQDQENNPLKYNIILHPGAKLEDLKFLISGASQVSCSNNRLLLATSLGTVAETIPTSYYAESPAVKPTIGFKLDQNTLSFCGAYQPGKTLIIDPLSNLIWSTYYGGASLDYCTATAVDAQDNVYLAGYCLSTNNIASNGSFQSTESGDLDAYLAKFDPNGNRLWGSYFGGSGFEQIFSMCITPNGDIYLSGDTDSPGGIASAGAFQSSYGGGIDDVLLIKFDGNGQRIWSTYYGGNEHDISQAVTVDLNGNVIIAGHSESAGTMATPGAYDTVYNLAYDVFIAKFDSSGSRIWGTYYGDSGIDEAYGLACDAQGNIYVTGMSLSVSNISGGPGFQMSPGGMQEAYLAKFDPSGGSLIWGTYYGGSGNDKGTCIKINADGNIILCGNTSSPNNMASQNAYQTSPGSSDDGFFSCFAPGGARLWGSYFGGNNVDYINALVIDANSNLLFCGQTVSTNNISTVGAYQNTLCTSNDYDAYFAKFSKDGYEKLSSYFGGPTNDNGQAIAVDHSGKIYLAGETTSTVGITSQGAWQVVEGGAKDGFLTKFCIPYEPLATVSGSLAGCMGTTTLTAQQGLANYLWNNTYNSNPLIVTYTTQGTYGYTIYVSDGFGCSGSDSLRLVIGNCYVSIPEVASKETLSLYPIPTQDHLTLTLEQETEIDSADIYSCAGQLLMRVELEGPLFQIDVKHLSPGMYLLKVNAGSRLYEKKFIKN